MVANIWINELEQDVTFSANVIRTNSLMAKDPKYYLEEIGWDLELYTPKENAIIEKYIENAVTQLFETIQTEANENY